MTDHFGLNAEELFFALLCLLIAAFALSQAVNSGFDAWLYGVLQ